MDLNSYFINFVSIDHSALATVLSDAKASEDSTTFSAAPESLTMDDSVVMLALAIFILSAPKEVVLASDLQQQCIKIFTRCLKSTIQVCLSLICSYLSVFLNLQCPHLTKGVWYRYNHLVLKLGKVLYSLEPGVFC